jgi:hypothetical protein
MGGLFMPAHARHQDGGTFEPSELDLFGRVLKKLNSQELTEVQRQVMALRVMANYMAGITDEDELFELSRTPLGR